ncbi:MAG: hypothetical protein E6Q98_08650 [Rhodospirillaceae bacterium]|nr:MAG: hypothetical protein E6Q98_08650 [Rhodospirillaceae bacterium]
MTEQLFTIEFEGRATCIVCAEDAATAIIIARGLLVNISISSSWKGSHPQTDVILSARQSTEREMKYFAQQSQRWRGETHLAALLIGDEDL